MALIDTFPNTVLWEMIKQVVFLKTDLFSPQKFRGDWQEYTTYQSGDSCRQNGNIYVSPDRHTASSSFEEDFAIGRWVLWQGLTGQMLSGPNSGQGSDLVGVLSTLGFAGTTLSEVLVELRNLFQEGAIAYETQALLYADLAHDEGTTAIVTNDSTPANNGYYRKVGASGTGSWAASADRVSEALQELDSMGNTIATINGLINVIHAYLSDGGIANYSGTDDYFPIVSDQNGKICIGVHKTTGKVLMELAPESIALISGEASGAGLNPLHVPVERDINHILFYGQSLSVGSYGQPPVSTTQPYSNITFNAGPKSTLAGSVGSNPGMDAFKPLTEDELSNTGDTINGETPCSGAANYATALRAMERGIIPADYVILASTAGHGGYAISQLAQGSAWYQLVLDSITSGKALSDAVGDSYGLHMVGWVQGERDAYDGTTRADYLAALRQLRSDIETDARTIVGRSDFVHLVTYQTSTRVLLTDGIALAQLDAVGSDDLIHFATPCYHLPFHTDGLHMTAVGYALLGRYFGRAYKELITGEEPQYIRPLSATERDGVLTLTFDVPAAPIVIDTTFLAATADHGFVVRDSSGDITLSDITAAGNTVTMTLGRAISGNAVVRYALDHLGTGLLLDDGASGNLRDSTTDTAVVSGQEHPLWHVCPHFELPVISIVL